MSYNLPSGFCQDIMSSFLSLTFLELSIKQITLNPSFFSPMIQSLKKLINYAAAIHAESLLVNIPLIIIFIIIKSYYKVIIILIIFCLLTHKILYFILTYKVNNNFLISPFWIIHLSLLDLYTQHITYNQIVFISNFYHQNIIQLVPLLKTRITRNEIWGKICF